MALVALEVNGAALTGAAAQGVLFNEPGVAVIERRRVMFGHGAAEQARRNPGQSYENYWELLSDEPLPRPVRGFRTYADLAHGQLRELWNRFRESAGDISGVILVIPAGASEDRLALLLGIAEEAGMPVAGLVESGVAAVRAIAGNRACLHIEATAERIVVSRLGLRDGRIHCEETLFDGRPGLRHLRGAMTRYAASRFVAGSRFDPLDLPATEQELDNQLDAWLEAVMTGGQLTVELRQATVPATANLIRDDFLAALERQLAALGNRLRFLCTGPEAAAVHISGALAAVPGCPAVFARLLSCEVNALQPGASALGALARFRPAAGKEKRYVLLRSLPAAEDSGTTGATGAPQATQPGADAGAGAAAGAEAGLAGVPPGGGAAAAIPTHLVQGGRAWRIGRDGLQLGSSPKSQGLAVVLSPEAGVSRNHCTVALENGQAVLHDHSRYGTRLNGAPIAESAPLRGGDIVGVGPLEFLVTRELGSDGA